MKKDVLQMQEPIPELHDHWYGDTHKQALLPAFLPLLFKILEQLTQKPSISMFLVSQEQVKEL
jgi:hypothetical protein